MRSRRVCRAGARGCHSGQLALHWMTQQDGVTIVISGVSSAEQARANAAVGSMALLPASTLAHLLELYDWRIRAQAYYVW